MLGQGGEIGVVLNQDSALRQGLGQQDVPVHALPLGEIGREAQAARPVQHAGCPDADGRCLPSARRSHIHGGVEVGHHFGHRLGHGDRNTSTDHITLARADRCGHPGFDQHTFGRAEGHTEHFGPPDVDAEGHVGTRRRSGVGRHDEDSTRAFSSRRAVDMIRLCARILMKPGMGTRSSTSRWYVTSVPVPPSPGSKT